MGNFRRLPADSIKKIKEKEIMIMKKNIGKRIVLTEDTQAMIIRIMEKLKQRGDHIRVKPAQLVSVVLERFEKKYFEKEMPYLEKCFFDNKLFLRNLINNSDDQSDLDKSLSKYLKVKKGDK